MNYNSFNSFENTLEPTLSFGEFSPMKYIKPLQLKDYQKLEKLGSGAQGEVWKARDPEGRIVALKLIRIKPGREEQLREAEKEVKYLAEISQPVCNPFIVCYYDSFYDGSINSYIIAMEYIEGETLLNYSSGLRAMANMRDSNYWYTLYRHLLLITKDLASALEYINSKDIIHNDIKPGNIMITEAGMIPKLVDFGLACTLNICQNTELCCKGFNGTPYFVAPETINTQTRYMTSDIWSLGVSLYQSATGTYPFNFPTNINRQIGDILAVIVEDEPNLLVTPNEKLNIIVNRALDKNPFTRITAAEISLVLSEL